MRALLLVPHELSDERHKSVQIGERPQPEYDAVAEAVRSVPGGCADILDLSSIKHEGGWLVRLVNRFLGGNWALAMLGYQRCREYDAVLTQSEVVGLPFALLAATLRRRPRHVMTGYYLDGKRNAVWYRILRAHNRIDKILVLGRQPYETGLRLGLPESKLVHIEVCGYIDTKFFAAAPAHIIDEQQLCSAGREYRDYETLIKAVADLPGVKLKIDPGSPWSLHRDQIRDMSIPPNVEICQMPMGTVRSLYAESAAVVIPLRTNPIGAGRTTLVEAMAMGKPVIVTRSQGNTYAGRSDIIDNDNVILVNPGDLADMRRAIERLMSDRDLRRRIGLNARRWAEKNAGRRQWLSIVCDALRGPVGAPRASIVAAIQS